MKKSNTAQIIVTIILFAAILLTSVLSACSFGTGESPDGSVIFGKNNFLFLKSSDTYHYLSDFTGSEPYTDEQLQNIYSALTKRATAMKNSNAEYMIAVIPNAQTVYSEYMPSQFGAPGNTKLSQLTAYLQEKGTINFLNLTDALTAAKGEGQLYNNTENTLNALGAYYAYQEIFSHFPENMTEKHSVNTELKNKIVTTEETGLSIAQSVGSSVKNKTLSLTLSEDEAIYTVLGSNETLATTYIKIGYKSQVPTVPSLLIDYGKASDFSAFLPYFSSTYGSVGYKSNFEYSASVIQSVYPRLALQLVYEDQLYTLLDGDINSTYNAALKPGDDPTTTMTPVLIDKVMTSADVACLTGTVEAGSVITVSGSGFDTFTTTAQHERFFISVPVAKGGEDTVSLTAKVEGKSASSPLEVKVSYAKGASLTVFAGLGSQLHYPDTLPDYYCNNLYKGNTLEKLEARLMQKLEKIRGASGKDTKLLFLIPPDAITAYPETATPEMAAKKESDYSRLQQVTDHFADNPDIIIVNLTKIILDNKDKGKLYYQTDTHWNTLGAYFGYYEMMRVISQDFPAAAPRELSEYKISQAYDPGGDLVSFLGVNNSIVNEYKTFCVPNFKNRAVITNYTTGSSNYVYSDQIKCVVDSVEGLPNAIMLTDSFGANLFDFVSDAFGVLVRQTMWEYKTDLKLIEQVKPDYYIQVMVERNMGIFGG